MKKHLILIIILSTYFLYSCNFKIKDNQLENKSNLTYMYIYNNENDSSKSLPTDSLCLYNDSTYEQSLNLYKNTDSICKSIDGILFFSVFKLNNEKFAIIVDSASTKVFKFSSASKKTEPPSPPSPP